MDGEDKEFAHTTNRTMSASVRKAARHRRIPSYYEFATDSREDEFVVWPAVDIFEDAHGIMVVAEMPGVGKERLNVQADRNSLLIEGEAARKTPEVTCVSDRGSMTSMSTASNVQ